MIKKKVIYPKIDLKDIKKGLEIPGSPGKQEEKGLAHSLIEGKKDKLQDGKLLDSSVNQGLFAFNPDMIYEHLVRDYSNAERIYGKTFLRQITGESSDILKKNLRFPEYKRELRDKLKLKLKSLEKHGLTKDGEITEKGFQLAALTIYMEELDDLEAKGLGERKSKHLHLYGDKENIRNFKKQDRYQDIALKKSIKKAIRRSHSSLEIDDLSVFERDSRGKVYIVYGLDASGSMKGQKIGVCKKAGIALAHKAIQEHDKVGLIVFGSEIEDILYPTNDFSLFLKSIVKVRAKKQTDIALTIQKAIEMFPSENITKHLVLLTDAVPTAGEEPKKKTLELVERAYNQGITISVIGISLDKEGTEIAKKIVEIGNGRLYIVRDLENLDRLILEDYYSL